MAVTTKAFNSSGMHCPSCSMLIDMTLKELEGVEDSRTDLASGITSVTYDDALQDPEGIIAAIRSAGYEAQIA